MGGKSQETETTQTSMPPPWAQPLLELAAKDAMKLYKSGQGFGTYVGPTMTDLSPQTLQAMNGLMNATGAVNSNISNAQIYRQVPVLNPDMMKTAKHREMLGKGGNGTGGDPNADGWGGGGNISSPYNPRPRKGGGSLW